MSQEKELAEKYPKLFPEKVACGVYFGDGWMPIVETLCGLLSSEQTTIKVVQIKEKFGVLRFYVDGKTNPWQTGAIAMAEAMSYKICERCSKPGTRRGEGWVKTLCDDCDADRYPEKTDA